MDPMFQMPESLPEIIPNRGASGPITQFPVKLALRESSPNPCSDPVHYVGRYPIQENCKRTTALVGATVVQFSYVNYEGKGSLMAVFSVRTLPSLITRNSFQNSYSDVYSMH